MSNIYLIKMENNNKMTFDDLIDNDEVISLII